VKIQIMEPKRKGPIREINIVGGRKGHGGRAKSSLFEAVRFRREAVRKKRAKGFRSGYDGAIVRAASRLFQTR